MHKLINDYIFQRDNDGIDVFTDEECKMLRDASNEIISSYTGMNK